MRPLVDYLVTAAFKSPFVRRPVEWIQRQLVAGNTTPQQAHQAVKQSFKSVESSKTVHRFGLIQPDGNFVGDGEHFDVVDDALTHTVEKAHVVTQSGEVVSPEHVASFCKFCGAFSAIELHCQKCAQSACRNCMRVFSEVTVSGMFCPRCYKEILFRLNTWEIADAQRTKTIPQDITTQAPFRPLRRDVQDQSPTQPPEEPLHDAPGFSHRRRSER